MRVEDLRIGNFVKYRDVPYMVDYIGSNHKVILWSPTITIVVHEKALSPISLDDSVLDKYLGKHSTYKDFYFGDIYHWDEYFVSRNKKDEEGTYYFGIPCVNSHDEFEPYKDYEIQGLHHLQNIYQVLHGEELKIDLWNK